MSRIGKAPVVLPTGISVSFIKNTQSSSEVSSKGLASGYREKISVSNAKDTLSYEIPSDVMCLHEGNLIKFQQKDKNSKDRSSVGLARTMVSNMVQGLVNGFEKKLLITGVGYKVNVNGNFLHLALGYSTDIVYSIPPGVSIKCEKNEVTISSFDKQKVGEVASQIRAIRKPEPYKGKGVRYAGEVVKIKKGKK